MIMHFFVFSTYQNHCNFRIIPIVILAEEAESENVSNTLPWMRGGGRSGGRGDHSLSTGAWLSSAVSRRSQSNDRLNNASSVRRSVHLYEDTVVRDSLSLSRSTSHKTLWAASPSQSQIRENPGNPPTWSLPRDTSAAAAAAGGPTTAVTAQHNTSTLLGSSSPTRAPTQARTSASPER